MDKTVYNEAAAAGASGETRDRVNNKSGMGSRLGGMTGAMSETLRLGQIEIEGTRVRESRTARLID